MNSPQKSRRENHEKQIKKVVETTSRFLISLSFKSWHIRSEVKSELDKLIFIDTKYVQHCFVAFSCGQKGDRKNKCRQCINITIRIFLSEQ